MREISTLARDAGSRLDPGVRRTLEGGFGTDLSAVRVHATGLGHGVAGSVEADAVAVGADLFFRDGAYDPGSVEGLWLLAHEVAHTVQQAHGWVAAAAPEPAWEVLADLAADRLVSGRPAPLGSLEAVPRELVPGRVAVQRHASWEHRLLGDARTPDLGSLAGHGADRPQLLAALRDFLQMWQVKPESVTAERINDCYPDIRTMRLRGSGLLVTYGELNTLPDYLPDATAMNDLPKDILLPILQAVRQEGYFHARWDPLESTCRHASLSIL